MNKEIVNYIEAQIRYYNSAGEEQVQELGNSGDEEFAKVNAYQDILDNIKELEAVDAMIEKLPETPKMGYLYSSFNRLKSLNNGDDYKGFIVVKNDNIPLDNIYFTPYPIDLSTVTIKVETNE